MGENSDNPDADARTISVAPRENLQESLANAQATDPTVSTPSPLADPHRLLDIHGVAKLLNLSKRTIDRLHAAGKLPRPIMFCRRPRWSRQTIVAFVAACDRAGRVLSRDEWEAMSTGNAARA